MKSSFGRTFTTLAVMLLATLLLIGISFQALVRNYLMEETTEDLKANATVIAELAEAFYADSNFSHRDFALALNVAATVSNGSPHSHSILQRRTITFSLGRAYLGAFLEY